MDRWTAGFIRCLLRPEAPDVTYAFLILVAAAVLGVTWILYSRESEFTAAQFPKTAAALGRVHTRFGAVYGAVEHVPISIRIVPSEPGGRDRIVIRAAAPGASARLAVRSVSGAAIDAPVEEAFANTFAAAGRPRAEVDALVPDEARAALVALARPERGARPSRPQGAAVAGYRADAKGTPPAPEGRPVELEVRGGELALTFEARRATDDELLAAVRAAVRCARRAMNGPYPERRPLHRMTFPAIYALLCASVGAVILGSNGFLSGLDGVAGYDGVRRTRGGLYTTYSVSVRTADGRSSLDVGRETFDACVGREVRRVSLSLRLECGGQPVWDLRPLWGLLGFAVAGLALGLEAVRRPDPRR